MLGRLIAPESRVLNRQDVFFGDAEDHGTRSGVAITQDSAFKIGACYAGVRLIADAISSLPVDVFFRKDGDRLPYRPKPLWVDNPEPDLSVQRVDHYQMVLVSMLLDGNAFVRVIRNAAGDVIALSVLNPTRVRVERSPHTGKIMFVIDNGLAVLGENDIIHMTELRRPGALRGVSRVDELKETLGLSKALEEFSAAFFGNGATTSAVIQVPQELDEEQSSRVKRQWARKHRGLKNAHEVGVLSGGATINKIGVDPNEAQMIESRQFAVEEVARIFRIPPHMLQSTVAGAMAYASVESNSLQFVTYTLLPYIRKIEDAYARLIPGGGFLKFNVDGLLRADLVSRYQAYSVGTQAGFLSINDIHRLEDMRPVAGGDEYRVPLANVNLSAANIAVAEKQMTMLNDLISNGADPDSAAAAVGIPPIKFVQPASA